MQASRHGAGLYGWRRKGEGESWGYGFGPAAVPPASRIRPDRGAGWVKPTDLSENVGRVVGWHPPLLLMSAIATGGLHPPYACLRLSRPALSQRTKKAKNRTN